MHLFEAIIDANHRAIAGDQSASVRVADFGDGLPVVALTCVDPRLNAIFPNVLGLPGEQFIWLRNAGNIITSPLSSTMRSLALACAVKGGREIAVIGHTDCQVSKTTTMQLLEKLKAEGIERHLLPENLSEFFGIFSSERQNVIKSCDFVRQSPLVGPKIPVHGFLVDIETGRLEWLVNGYQNLELMTGRWNEAVKSAGETVGALGAMADFHIGDMKFTETKIGEAMGKAEDWLSKKIGELEIKSTPEVPSGLQTAANVAKKMVEIAEKHWPAPEGAPPPPLPPKVPLPPRVRPRMGIKRSKPY